MNRAKPLSVNVSSPVSSVLGSPKLTSPRMGRLMRGAKVMNMGLCRYLISATKVMTLLVIEISRSSMPENL